MAELTFDVLENILVRLDVQDLLRCKKVCKSWQSFISSPRFVKAHLNHAYTNDRNNPELGHRRMAMPSRSSTYDWINCNSFRIVGSCNGLVCICATHAELEVINPLTREVKKLQTLPHGPDMHKLETISSFSKIWQVVCWGFGYDSSADDYKVIAGFRKRYSRRTLFYVLSLKSNIWKVIGEITYMCLDRVDGVLCSGSLHWFMRAANKKVIISLDFSTQEFREIPQPTSDEEYECDDDHRLGVMEECLCIYSTFSPLSTKKWVLRNNKWELYNDDCENKYDVAHFLNRVVELYDGTSYICSDDYGTRVPSNGDYICTSIFVKSLISPHPYVNSDNNYDEGKKWNAEQGLELNKSVESSAKSSIRKRKIEE